MKWNCFNAVSQNSNHCRLDSGGRWVLRRRQHIEYIVIRKSKRKSIMFFHIFPYPQVEFNEFLGYFFFCFFAAQESGELFSIMFTKYFHNYAKEILFINHLSVLKWNRWHNLWEERLGRRRMVFLCCHFMLWFGKMCELIAYLVWNTFGRADDVFDAFALRLLVVVKRSSFS